MQTRTKIICTMGPAVRSLEKILALIDAGMNVARLNFSHGTQAEHAEVIQMLKEAREIRKVPLAIMADTKGPEIRVGKIQNGHLTVAPKQKILLVKQPVEGDANQIHVHPGNVLDSVDVGTTILFDDGYILSKVVDITPKGVMIEIQNSGVIKTSKGVNIPNCNVDLPAMTEGDISDLVFACKQDVDLIAASFIRSAEHVLEIRKLLTEEGKPEILIIAKIENALGVQNFDSIVEAADGIMVARGDLGVELPLEKVPSLQKMMIHKCYHACKPVVTATQMLESMIKNPRPTRAEVSDVANAIYDSTSSVMLSGETAAGLYPIETVSVMKSIVAEAESQFNYRDFFFHESQKECTDLVSSLALAAVRTAYSAGAKAIFVCTTGGFTARLVSRFRPAIPVIALTPHHKAYNQLAFNWGVIPVEPTETRDIQKAFEILRAFALKKGLIRQGDLIIVVSGSSGGPHGIANMMALERCE